MPDDERRCPSCGALVAPDATWCGQCFATLDRGVEPAPEPTPAPAQAPTDGAEAPPVPAPPPGTPSEARWPCQVCGTRNPLTEDACTACGSPFAASMRSGVDRPTVPARDAVLWSLAFPGLGHRLTGHTTDGLVRGILFAMSLGMSVLLFVAGGGSGATTGVLLLFVLATVGVYVISALEAARLAAGGDVLVGSRVLLWVVVGMTFLSVGALAIAVVGASRG